MMNAKFDCSYDYDEASETAFYVYDEANGIFSIAKMYQEQDNL